MIKIEQTQYTHQAMRAIGAGFQSVLFADIRTVEDAKTAVNAVRAETTMAKGVRGRGLLGVGMRRDVGIVRQGGTPAYVDALNEVVIAIMVEKKSCVDDLDAILSVPGIDMVQFGASDFSMSIGKTGQYGHPDVLAAETKTIQTALKKGLHPRVELRDPSAGRPLPRDGRQAFLHRLGRAHPRRLVGHQGRRDAQAPARQAEEGGGQARAGASKTRQAARPTARNAAITPERAAEKPPVAPRRPSRRTLHGVTLTDDYAWLKDANWQEVLRDPALLDPDIRSYLEAENRYTEAILGPTAGAAEDAGRRDARAHQGGRFRRARAGRAVRLSLEISRGRPARADRPHAARRRRASRSSSTAMRWPRRRTTSTSASTRHSPDHRLEAWSADLRGSEYFTIRVRAGRAARTCPTSSSRPAAASCGAAIRRSSSMSASTRTTGR